MVKRITALAVSLVMLFSIPVLGQKFSDVEEGTAYGEAIEVLSELGVLSGMGDGTFSPYTGLTRAQFAKIAVSIMGKDDEAVVTTDAFSDVNSSHWYSGYVNVVANEGIITGYPDGSFGAEDYITYAQAITILIRLLGYDATDVGHKWPQGYIDKAKVLGITDGINFSNNDVITRQEAALIIYRSLFADMNGAGEKLVTRMKADVYEDTVITATKNQNASLLSNQVQSDKGIFTTNKSMENYLGCEGTLVTDEKGNVITFVEKADISKETYTLTGVYASEDSVYVITEEMGTITLNGKMTVYVKGAKNVAESLSEGVNTGSEITLFKENGSLKYAFVDEYKYEGPKVVASVKGVENLFYIKDWDTLKIIRKGLSANLEDIQLYDVLYYSERTNTLYCYADRVTGVYEEAYPMKSNVSRVVVSGKTYYLSNQEAVNKLNESPYAFDIGDRVTLLLGQDGKVVDAVSLTDADMSSYGVITATGMRISQEEDTLGRTEYYVTFMNTKGEETDYVVEDNSYSHKAGEFCEIDFNKGMAAFSFPKSASKSGMIDKDDKTFGDCPFASDFAVMEYEDGNEEKAVVAMLSLADIDKVKIMKNRVKHCQLNDKGEIVVLYVDNVSGNRNKYGIIVSAPETKSGTYTVLSGMDKYNVTGTFTSLEQGDGVIYYQGIEEKTVTPMIKVVTANSITSYTDNIIKINSTAYTLSDDVTIYAGRYASELKTVSLDDAVSLTGRITLYSDKSVLSGGKIRVIKIITG